MPDTPNLLFLHGSDELAISDHINKMVKGMGDPSTAGMNISKFDGRQGFGFEAFNNAVNAVPFLSPARLVVLDHPTAAFPAQKRKPAAGDPQPQAEEEIAPSGNRKKFLELLDHLPPTTTLVLVEAEALKNDHWLVKWAQKNSGRMQVRVYSMPRQQEMPRWIESEARKQGGKIEPDAAFRLAEMTGENTRIASQELTKLLTYANYERPVTTADVEKVSIVTAQGDIFVLVDALGTGNGKKAQKVLHQLLEEDDPMSIWGMIIRQFRLLLQVREILDEHGTSLQVEKDLKIHTYVAEKVTSQARRFTLQKLEAIYHRLLEMDHNSKTSRVPLDLALDMLVMELTGK